MTSVGGRVCSLREKSSGAFKDRKGEAVPQVPEEEDRLSRPCQEEKRGDAGGAAGHEEEGRGIERPRYHCRILVSWSENRVIMQCNVMSDSWKGLTPVHDFKHSSVIACLNL